MSAEPPGCVLKARDRLFPSWGLSAVAEIWGEKNKVASSRKRKHIPQRTCVACRSVRPKRELTRLVRTPEGEVVVDETGKQSGRGAYLCPTADCWETALAKGALDRALRTKLTDETKARLQDYADRLRR